MVREPGPPAPHPRGSSTGSGRPSAPGTTVGGPRKPTSTRSSSATGISAPPWSTRTCSIGAQPESEVPPTGCSCRDLAGFRRRDHRRRSDATQQRLAVYLGEPTATRVTTSRNLKPPPLAFGSLNPDIQNCAKRSPSSREIAFAALAAGPGGDRVAIVEGTATYATGEIVIGMNNRRD